MRPQVMMLWDVVWTRSKSENFCLFVAVAVLDLHEADIVNTARRPDEMLEYFAQLVERTSCEEAIQRARMVGSGWSEQGAKGAESGEEEGRAVPLIISPLPRRLLP